MPSAERLRGKTTAIFFSGHMTDSPAIVIGIGEDGVLHHGVKACSKASNFETPFVVT